MIRKTILLIAILLVSINHLYSQDTLFVAYDKQRINHQKTGMIVLMTWAGANIMSGTIYRNNAEGDTKYFHEMNALFNTVNLFLGASGYYNASRETPRSEAFHILGQQLKLEKTLLFNVGIDVAYTATGLYLLEKGNNQNDILSRQRLRGYGRSLILQGAFLFLFDGIFYGIEANASNNLREAMSMIFISSSGIGLNYRF
jgi:hypothetical protein